MTCVFSCILPPFLTLDKGGVAKRTLYIGWVLNLCAWTHSRPTGAKTQLLQSDIHELG